MMISELQVGHFAERNKSVVYRFKTPIGTHYPWNDGLLIVEQHPSTPIGEDTPEETIKNNMMAIPSHYRYDGKSISYIEKPKKKHVDNTIKLLHDNLKDKKIDNLTYIENFSILKNYLKTDIVVKE